MVEGHTIFSPGNHIESIVLQGADVDGYNTSFLRHRGDTPLLTACSINRLDYVETLLDAGANINKQNDSGANAIIRASEKGNADIVKHLLARGSDSSRPDNCNHSPLMMACFYDHLETAITLVEGGLDVEEKDDNGNTSLALAVAEKNLGIVKMLIKVGARVNTVNNEGETPLMLATSTSDTGTINTLKASGADIDVASLSLSQRLRFGHTGLNNTFNPEDLLPPATSPTQNSLLGVCENIDHIKLEDGRCVHNSTRDARRVMMTLLGRPVETGRIVLPTQSSGTCWFFATLAQMFVSDRTRIALLPLRRSMIMGRKTVDGEKFPKPVVFLMAKFNMMIQAILDGNSRNGAKEATLPIIQSEEVVVDMFHNSLSRGLINDGWNSAPFVDKLCDLLSPRKRFLVQDNQAETSTDPNHPVARFIPYVRSITSPALLIQGQKYFLDSAAISEHNHVISAITLGGVRYIYDSNVGKIKLDWFKLLKEPTKTFKIATRKYSFSASKVTLNYILLP